VQGVHTLRTVYIYTCIYVCKVLYSMYDDLNGGLLQLCTSTLYTVALSLVESRERDGKEREQGKTKTLIQKTLSRQ
jgi:hypothetical protein